MTEREVSAAIAECLTEPITGAKRSVLADLIIIYEYLFGQPAPSANPPALKLDDAGAVAGDIVAATTERSEFLRLVEGRKSKKAWDVVDELVEAVRVLHPNMYSAFVDKMRDS